MSTANNSARGLSELVDLAERQPDVSAASSRHFGLRHWGVALFAATCLLLLCRHALTSQTADPAPTVHESDAGSSLPQPVAGGEIVVTGTFSAEQVAQLSSTVLARVRAIHVTEGSRVERGDLLVELDAVREDADIEALRHGQQASAAQAKLAALKEHRARSELERQQGLLLRGFVASDALERARLEVDQAHLQWEVSQAQVQELQARLAAAARARDEYRVRAPFDGLVMARTARVGEVIAPLSQADGASRSLVTLLDPASVRVEVAVPERLLPKLRPGMCALVTSLAQPQLFTRSVHVIERISPAADRQRGTLKVMLRALRVSESIPILDSAADVAFVPQRTCVPESVE